MQVADVFNSFFSFLLCFLYFTSLVYKSFLNPTSIVVKKGALKRLADRVGRMNRLIFVGQHIIDDDNWKVSLRFLQLFTFSIVRAHLWISG
jgi:hypothetical protein